jgi:NADH dehydrogenase
MKVFVTGGTGYVGAAVVRRLLADGHEVRCLVRQPGKLGALTSGAPNASEVRGDLLAPESYSKALAGADAVVHLVGIIREKIGKGMTFESIHVDGTRLVVDAARQAGVRRFVHMSALGARRGAVSGYHRSKWEAEEIVRGSGMTATIFRPSVIFGPDDEFVRLLAGIVKAPLTPVFGNGLYRMQPVSIHTVADVFAKAITRPQAERHESFDVGGPQQLPYNEMLKEIGRALGRSVYLLHVPLWVTKPMVAALHRMPGFPVTKDQLTMLLEENICRDGNRFVHAFGVQEIRFAEGIREYVSAGS